MTGVCFMVDARKGREHMLASVTDAELAMELKTWAEDKGFKVTLKEQSAAKEKQS